MTHFNTSLSVGKIRENEICNFIRRKYSLAFVVDGYFKGYDIYIPEVDKSIEVKQDYKSYYTGNFLVEIEFEGIESGLSTTIADFWVFVDRQYYIWVTPETLWLLINERNLKPKKFIGKGDTKEKKAYLIPRKMLIYSPYVVLTKLPIDKN